MMLTCEVKVMLVYIAALPLSFLVDSGRHTDLLTKPDCFLTLSFFTLSSSRPPQGLLRKNLKVTPNPTFPVAADSQGAC